MHLDTTTCAACSQSILPFQSVPLLIEEKNQCWISWPGPLVFGCIRFVMNLMSLGQSASTDSVAPGRGCCQHHIRIHGHAFETSISWFHTYTAHDAPRTNTGVGAPLSWQASKMPKAQDNVYNGHAAGHATYLTCTTNRAWSKEDAHHHTSSKDPKEAALETTATAHF